MEAQDLTDGESQFYNRPDIDVYEVGAIVQYVFNNEKFSYRASFMQNEWQKKSAGSLLLGAEIFFGNVRSDSTAVPTIVNEVVASQQHNDLGFVEIGPNVGYAHTFVINKHFFLHGSFSLGLTVGSTTYEGIEGKTTETGLSPNSTLRLAAGYNSEKWVLNLLFTNTQVEVNRAQSPQKLGIDTGNIRFIYARRFSAGKKLQKKLNKLPTID